MAVPRLPGLLRLEIHCHAVDAIAQMGWRRAVFKDMAEMAAAAAAVHLGADHAVTAGGRGLDCVGLGIIGARAAGAPPELGLGDEQLLSATGTIERAGALFIIQRAAARPLGAVLAHDVILLGAENFAPFRFGMADRILLGFRVGAHGDMPYWI